LPHAENFSRDDFLPGPGNHAALTLIEQWPDWAHPVMVLTGPEGAGKSHLAAIWAELSGARSLAARNLTVTTAPAALATGALVLDDLDPAEQDSRALFHLLNLAREEGASMLITSRIPTAAFRTPLRDLESRLRALPQVAIEAADENLLRALIVKFCADRQMTVDDGLVGYLLDRIERSPAAARRIVERLDTEALRLRRPVTKALAAELLRTALP
jgi:chromosomal replication initiation ATPase DnaA